MSVKKVGRRRGAQNGVPHRTPGMRYADAAGENGSHRGEAVGDSSVLSPPSAFTAVGVCPPTVRDTGDRGRVSTVMVAKRRSERDPPVPILTAGLFEACAA